MNWRDIRSLETGMLRTFSALIAERSVSRAAARLFLSQSAVSASLNRLRETFGDPLFTRTGHGVTPTPRALALAPQIDKLLDDMVALLDQGPTSGQDFNPTSSSRVFRIAGGDVPSQRVLPWLGRTLADCRSGIRIVWEPPGTWSLPERLAKGELDLAMVARIQRPRDMESVVLYEDHYVYAMRTGHPLAGQPVTRESFCATPQIFLGYGTSMLDDLIDDTLAKTGHLRQAQIAVTSFGQILNLLQHSDHAAVLPNRVAQAHAPQLHIQPLPFTLPNYQSLLCWDARAHGDAGIAWLKAEILRIVA